MLPAAGESSVRRVNPRLLQWVFAAFAAIATSVLLTGSGPAFFRVMGAAGYAIGAVVSVIAARRWERGGRRIAIGAHLALAPLQFVFSIGSSVTLIGIVISLLILARSRPRFPRLSPRARRVWLVLHVGFSVGWLGVALTMTVLAITGQLATSLALTACLAAFVVALWVATVLSVAKPWGRTRWGTRALAQARPVPVP
jgi:hypothetical protein